MSCNRQQPTLERGVLLVAWSRHATTNMILSHNRIFLLLEPTSFFVVAGDGEAILLELASFFCSNRPNLLLQPGNAGGIFCFNPATARQFLLELAFFVATGYYFCYYLDQQAQPSGTSDRGELRQATSESWNRTNEVLQP